MKNSTLIPLMWKNRDTGAKENLTRHFPAVEDKVLAPYRKALKRWRKGGCSEAAIRGDDGLVFIFRDSG